MLVAEAPITMDYGPWKKMSAEGVDFLQGCLDRDYPQRMTVRQVRGAVARLGVHWLLACCLVMFQSSLVVSCLVAKRLNCVPC